MATACNQLWSWDITKLLGPAKWTYFYLYVLLDVFSRYITGWMVAYRESAELAKRLIEESCKKQDIQPGQLTLHADRGTSMRSKPIWVSRKRIAGRTCRTTIPFPRANFEP
jgi:putative transposase